MGWIQFLAIHKYIQFGLESSIQPRLLQSILQQSQPILQSIHTRCWWLPARVHSIRKPWQRLLNTIRILSSCVANLPRRLPKLFIPNCGRLAIILSTTIQFEWWIHINFKKTPHTIENDTYVALDHVHNFCCLGRF